MDTALVQNPLTRMPELIDASGVNSLPVPWGPELLEAV
jgi:hypothetical protein